MSRVGAILREARGRRAWTPQQLAAAVGYRNADKGARRILDIEQGAADRHALVNRVAKALDVERHPLEEAARADERDRVAAWAKRIRHVEPVLLLRRMACVWEEYALPPGLASRGAEEWAASLSRAQQCAAVLEFGAVRVHFDRRGKVISRAEIGPDDDPLRPGSLFVR